MKKVILILLFVPMILAAQNSQEFIGLGSEWKYYDKPSYPGDDWIKKNFNDSQWKSGKAELGYGDGDEKTVISHGEKNDDKHITAYFRKTFDAKDPDKFRSIELKIKRDDGAVVFINGVEIFRSNMPAGKIGMDTKASSAIAGGNENMYIPTPLQKGTLINGKNIIAVEVHQDNAASSDLSFDLSIVGNNNAVVVRGPYLQSPSSTSMTVRWSTSLPTKGAIQYGTTSVYSDSVIATESSDEHLVKLDGLKPFSKYYYSVYTVGEKVNQDTNNFFYTAPVDGQNVPVRIWAMGDFGSTGTEQVAVRNAYYQFSGNTYTNLLLWLGDDAYSSGTTEEYTSNVFIPYRKILAQSPVYSSTGNHDLFSSNVVNESGPYFDLFTFPKKGECGGVPSGSEAYYSFNYGNIHFICLESNIDSFGDRKIEMMKWLKSDLAANKSKWTIAYFHYAIYSKGYHDSDVDKIMTWMRENVAPVLEEGGTDLVLAGHVHDYERSFLLNGHYGKASTLAKSMIVDAGKGTDPAVYTKKGKGTMYIIAGCMGETQPANKSWPHPVNAKSFQKIFGALILDIDENKIEGKLLVKDGSFKDRFVINKTQ